MMARQWLHLDDADLVTLSACQTQLGDLSAGDELVGLSRAFIYAGTPSLAASLWSVEDASTAYLMTHFYGYLQAGMGKGAAMRQAQLDTMQEYPSPFYWTAFTLIGDMGTLGTLDHAEPVETAEAPEESEPPDVPSRRWLWVGGAVLLVAVGGAWVWRRKLHI
jgi:hypothetical protein